MPMSGVLVSILRAGIISESTEPYLAEWNCYSILFGILRYSNTVSGEEQERRIAAHWDDVTECYRQLTINRLEEVRRQLCLDAESLDPNTNVHVMLRLAKGESRRKLEGRLGGAMHLKTMAEIFRRATESAHNVTLPEEDEIGSGMMPLNLKKDLYGSNRLLDGNDYAVNEFIRQFRLDYGMHVRWYVEGDTEYYGLKHLFAELGVRYVDLVNLRGQVVQKGGRGLAFLDSLR